MLVRVDLRSEILPSGMASAKSLSQGHAVELAHFHATDESREDVSTGVRQFMVSLFQPAKVDSTLPVLIYSPGGQSDRFSNAATCQGLASRGFVVFTLDTPRDAPAMELPDGQIVTPPLAEGESYIWPRVADIRYLMDQMSLIEGIALDGRSVGLFGHSRGGYVSVITAVVDPRVTAAANMDGFFWGLWTNNRSTGLDRLPVDFQEKARSCRTPVLRLQSDQGSVEAARAVFERESADLAGPFTYASMNGFKHGSFTFASAAGDCMGADLERQNLLEDLLAEFFKSNSTKTLTPAQCRKFEIRH